MRCAVVCVVLAACRYEPQPPAVADDDVPTIDAPADSASDAFVAACVTNPAYVASPSGARYRITDTNVDYDTAIDQCTADGAHLAVVDDMTENLYLASIAANELWIGFDDLTTETTFRWVTGAPVAFMGFTGGEPNDSGIEDCAALRKDGSWNDTNCGDTTRPGACECDAAYRAPPTPACRTASGETVLDGRRYFVRTAPLSWDAAEADCASIGAHLAAVADLDENDQIFQTLDVDLWIGLDDQVTEGAFVWTNGAPAGFTNFGVPTTNPTEDCVDVDAPNATWNDTECTGTKPYVCECDPAPP